MRLQVKNLTDLLIAASGQNSNTLGPDEIRDSEFITIYSPGVLTGTASSHISDDNSTWATVTGEGFDVFLPAGKTKQVFINERSCIRLLSDAAEGSDRTFKILPQQA
jgi:hypothetical protein